MTRRYFPNNPQQAWDSSSDGWDDAAQLAPYFGVAGFPVRGDGPRGLWQLACMQSHGQPRRAWG